MVILYAEGNGNICSLAEQKIKEHSKGVYLIMDAVPENSSVERIYESLKQLSERFAEIKEVLSNL